MNEYKVDTYVTTTKVKNIKRIIPFIIGILTIKTLLKANLPKSLTWLW